MFELGHTGNAASDILEGVPVDHLPLQYIGNRIDFPLIEKLETGHYAIASL
jgi:hypothetical protein